MELEFVPVEEFFFALTLSVRLLEEIEDPDLLAQVKAYLQDNYGQPSTVAAAQDNTFNYVFRLFGYPDTDQPFWLVSLSDKNNRLRLSSDYGWSLNADRKPTRTEYFSQRSDFTHQLKRFLQELFQIPLLAPLSSSEESP